MSPFAIYQVPATLPLFGNRVLNSLHRAIEISMNTESIDLQAFDYILDKVSDGFLFERFVQDLLCQIIGVEFIPAGGVKDRGIDGLDHTSFPTGNERTIYQVSIEADPKAKILKTLNSLRKNKIDLLRLFYVTNRVVPQQDKLAEDVFAEFGVVLLCRDIAWLRGNVASSEATLRVYAD